MNEESIDLLPTYGMHGGEKRKYISRFFPVDWVDYIMSN